jgi:hypothetical protein
MQQYPNKSKSFLANIDRAVHTWLYRHDNDWLKENSPRKKVGNRKEQLIDWEERDQEILVLVKGAVEALKNSEDFQMRRVKWCGFLFLLLLWKMGV